MLIQERCEICGMTSLETELVDAIISGEIVKVCNSCAERDELVLVSRPTSAQLKEASRPFTVSERLHKMAGIKLTKDEMQARAAERKRENRINLAVLEAKKSEKAVQQQASKQDLDFRSKDITIADLRKMKEKQESEKSE